LKFEIGDETDRYFVDVLSHDFAMCEEAFDKFVLFAGSNIMGNTDSNVKLNSYNAYSGFITKLYEFYVGCFKRDRRDTKSISYETLDSLFTLEAEKLMKNRRNAIKKGYAPEYENHISYYQEAVPTDFGKDFRDVRNNTSHTDYRRAGGNRIGLMDFYRKHHKYVYLLYYSALFAWSRRTHQNHKIEHIEEFDFFGGR
jgi:hypothetical protein